MTRLIEKKGLPLHPRRLRTWLWILQFPLGLLHYRLPCQRLSYRVWCICLPVYRVLKRVCLGMEETSHSDDTYTVNQRRYSSTSKRPAYHPSLSLTKHLSQTWGSWGPKYIESSSVKGISNAAHWRWASSMTLLSRSISKSSTLWLNSSFGCCT